MNVQTEGCCQGDWQHQMTTLTQVWDTGKARVSGGRGVGGAWGINHTTTSAAERSGASSDLS